MVEGVWVQRVTGPSTYRDERDGFVAALVLEGGSAPSLASPILRTVRCQAGEWDARRTVVAGSAEPYLRGALAELLSARSAHQAERDEHERWREQLTERAHVEADDRGWCPTFDRFLVEAGLRPRTRDYSVAVEVSFTVYVPVNAIDEDDAMEQVDNHAVREAVRAHDLGSGDWSADSADED